MRLWCQSLVPTPANKVCVNFSPVGNALRTGAALVSANKTIEKYLQYPAGVQCRCGACQQTLVFILREKPRIGVEGEVLSANTKIAFAVCSMFDIRVYMLIK